jgi:hypothetical protein
MPAPTLARELSLLLERWHPQPVLLLLGAEGPYDAAFLLALPAAGLLQQPDGKTVREAVATLLAGGRVIDLQGESSGASEAAPPGLGQWLLQTGLQQIQAEEARCRQWLALADAGSLSELLLNGRLRELAAARGLLLWLWGPLSLAWGSAANASAATGALATAPPAIWGSGGSGNPSEGPSSTAITLRERTAQGSGWRSASGSTRPPPWA